MIPLFPKFRLVDKSCLGQIEKIVSYYEPYSDFNALSLYAWNDQSTYCSMLGSALVIRIRDYNSSKNIITFVGELDNSDALYDLINMANRQRVNTDIRLIGHDTYKDLPFETKKLFVEDRVHFDYIVNVNYYLNSSNRRIAERRRRSRKFTQTYPDARIRHYHQLDAEVLEAINIAKLPNTNFENTATFRMLDLARDDMRVLVVSSRSRVIGYSILQILNQIYAIGHFQTYDKSYKYLGEYLIMEVVKQSKEDGVRLINIEQDLGIAGLRSFKSSLNNGVFLKKYILKQDHSSTPT